MVIQVMILSKNKKTSENISKISFSTANGVPGSISEMAESWKVEQTCVTGPSPVMDSSAPCANYEARKEWAEKECHMVSIKSYSVRPLDSDVDFRETDKDRR